MRKSHIFVAFFFLMLFFLAGCNPIPQLKDSADISFPSWETDMVIPVIKGEIPVGDLIIDNIEISDFAPDPETNIFTYTFQGESDSLAIEEIPIVTDTLGLDIGEVWNEGALTIDPGVQTQSLDTPYIVGSQSFKFFDITGNLPLSSLLFDRVRLSSNSINKIDFTVTTDNSLDSLKIYLIDTSGNQISPDYLDLTFASADTKVGSISIADCEIPDSLDLLIEYTSSYTGNVSIIPSIGQLEIVEIDTNIIPSDLSISIPTIDIPPIDPFETFKIDDTYLLKSIEFISGKIGININKVQADLIKPFPFDIQFDIFYDGVSVLETDPDTGDMFIDLTDMTFEAGKTFTGQVSVNFADPFLYDVWDDSLNQIVNYSYAIDFEMSDLVINKIVGDISQIVQDWNFSLDEFDNSIQEINYPDSFPDEIPGIKDIYLTLNLENQTDFSGSLTFAINVHQDNSGTPLLDENNEPVKASFTINLPSRTNYEFNLHEQPDYEKFKEIITSKPQYISFDAELNLNQPDSDFVIQVGDYIKPSFSVKLPAALTIPAGGITVENIYEEQVNQLDLEGADEYINSATLHIRYENNTTVGFGSLFKFTSPDGEPYPIELILYPEKNDEITLSYTPELQQILTNPSGFTVSADLIIPNDSSEPYDMMLKSTDNIKFTIWIDGSIDVHIPEEGI